MCQKSACGQGEWVTDIVNSWYVCASPVIDHLSVCDLVMCLLTLISELKFWLPCSPHAGTGWYLTSVFVGIILELLHLFLRGNSHQMSKLGYYCFLTSPDFWIFAWNFLTSLKVFKLQVSAEICCYGEVVDNTICCTYSPV